MPRRGLSFSVHEIETLVEIVEEVKPSNATEWDLVEQKHQSRFPDKNRTKEALRRKFQSVYLTRISTDGTVQEEDGTAGSTKIPVPCIRKAKAVYEEMKRKVDSSPSSDDKVTTVIIKKNDEAPVGATADAAPLAGKGQNGKDNDSDGDEKHGDNNPSLLSDEKDHANDKEASKNIATTANETVGTSLAIDSSIQMKKRKSPESLSSSISNDNPIKYQKLPSSNHNNNSNSIESSVDKLIQFMITQRELDRQERREEEKARRLAEEERNNQMQSLMRMMMIHMMSTTRDKNNKIPIAIEDVNVVLDSNRDNNKGVESNFDKLHLEKQAADSATVTAVETAPTTEEV